MQKQDEDSADSHSVCGETPLPGTAVDEHRSSHVHQQIRSVHQVKGILLKGPDEALERETHEVAWCAL